MLVAICAVLLVLSGIPAFFLNQGQEPDIEKAPWKVLTYSYIGDKVLPLRTYYGEQYAVTDGEPSLAGVWEFDGKRYIYHKSIKVFEEAEWGPVTVIRRAS
ncbi:MAG: hypothetical protein KKD44_27345 [Proteobacteria bacterium]|nr:hypothetical protein [Pseudomonadota bacterium]